MKTKVLLLIIAGILFSCSSDDANQTIDMRINHYQSTGIGEGLFLTLLVQENNNIGSGNWNKFYDSIEGFNYQPGFIYDIRVVVELIDNPHVDVSSLKCTLQEIKSTKEVNSETTFDIDLKINGESFITSTPSYKILDQIKIDCNTLCNELDIKLENQDFIIGTFKRLQREEIQLINLK
ncbi:DUF4377 domain-containing protein [Cellulophaga sp. HaHaR_3_176]|uniref:DUF4377 domain-containing protein n=1 Tax=Cellulophaga sp. HaHaR_3_176 TaxID=1942464 RepID=UPI001C1F5747|nr:DUF4377 domain-containing protein [Cellulophaga sp. HaHaR_3_176]QWX84601.1 DUF4377 domain-containing protein [Cellulophaga sp. HaHaR_3_176]